MEKYKGRARSQTGDPQEEGTAKADPKCDHHGGQALHCTGLLGFQQIRYQMCQRERGQKSSSIQRANPGKFEVACWGGYLNVPVSVHESTVGLLCISVYFEFLRSSRQTDQIQAPKIQCLVSNSYHQPYFRRPHLILNEAKKGKRNLSI